MGKLLISDVTFLLIHSFAILLPSEITTITDRVTILAHDARLVKYIDDKSRTVKVTIGNNVFIGVGSIILPNVTIGDNAIIGAGSVVTHDVLGKTVVAGNPARQVNTLEGFIKKYSTNVNWDK